MEGRTEGHELKPNQISHINPIETSTKNLNNKVLPLQIRDY